MSSGDILSFLQDVKGGIIPISSIKEQIQGSISTPHFRFHFLNEDESTRELIPPEDIILGGSYSETYQDGQRRTLSFSLFNYDGKYTPGINSIWANTKISFEQGIELEDGSITWFKKGVYGVTSVSPSLDTSARTVSVEAADKFSILEGKRGTLGSSYVIPPGVKIIDVVRDLLNLQNGNGAMLDPAAIIYDSALYDKKTEATITKDAGDTVGSIILELAQMMSAEVFYNSEGNLTFIPQSDSTNDIDKPIIYQFFDSNGDFSSLSFSFSFEDIVNRIIVVGGSVNGGVSRAVAENNDASSPLSVQRIGYRTGNIINDSNITSDQLAQERADYELRQSLILKTSSSTNVPYNPLLSVNNLVGVTAEFYDFQQEYFLLRQISCPIDYSGMMSISISNTRNFPFATR